MLDAKNRLLFHWQLDMCLQLARDISLDFLGLVLAPRFHLICRKPTKRNSTKNAIYILFNIYI